MSDNEEEKKPDDSNESTKKRDKKASSKTHALKDETEKVDGLDKDEPE